MSEHRIPYQDQDGVRRTAIWDDERPNEVTVQTEENIGPALDSIARDRELMPHGTNKLAARLPVTIVEDLIHRGIYNDEDAFKKWLNGPEAAPWRIWKGQV